MRSPRSDVQVDTEGDPPDMPLRTAAVRPIPAVQVVMAISKKLPSALQPERYRLHSGATVQLSTQLPNGYFRYGTVSPDKTWGSWGACPISKKGIHNS